MSPRVPLFVSFFGGNFFSLKLLPKFLYEFLLGFLQECFLGFLQENIDPGGILEGPRKVSGTASGISSNSLEFLWNSFGSHLMQILHVFHGISYAISSGVPYEILLCFFFLRGILTGIAWGIPPTFFKRISIGVPSGILPIVETIIPFLLFSLQKYL